MNFTETIRNILASAGSPLTPQEIREVIKNKYSALYGTPAHVRNVDKGHYKDLNHALLAQIYLTTSHSRDFFCDKSTKPMKVSLLAQGIVQERTLAQPAVHHHPSRKRHSYAEKARQVIDNAENYHLAYYRAELFSGPCLYFHLRALETRQPPASKEHLEYVYATLVSWGMHRLGKGGSKMLDFKNFSESITAIKDKILEAQYYDCCEMDEQKWSVLESIFMSIHVMASESNLVGNSKVMHHMLPNIVPPIDRTYTLSFLRDSTNIANDKNLEWQLMKEVIVDFFVPVAVDDIFRQKATDWMRRTEEFPWDTSLLKIVDNLVIGAQK